MNTLILSLLSMVAISSAAKADPSLIAVKSVQISHPIQISMSNDQFDKNENYAYMQDGKLLETMDINKSFCVVVVNADQNEGMILPTALTIVSSDQGGHQPSIQLGQRAVNFYFSDILIKRIMCVSALAGADVVPTIENAQEAVGSYIQFSE